MSLICGGRLSVARRSRQLDPCSEVSRRRRDQATAPRHPSEIGGWWCSIGVAVGVPMGVVAGAKRGSWTDFALLNVSLLGYVTPGVCLGRCVHPRLRRVPQGSPAVGFTPFFQSPGPQPSRNSYSPWMLTLGVAFAGSITRLTRVNIVLSDQVYITTARAKGLREKLAPSCHYSKTG